MSIEKKFFQRMFAKKPDDLSSVDKTLKDKEAAIKTDAISAETNQKKNKTPLINKFLDQIDSYMNPPRPAILMEEWGKNFDGLINEIKNYEEAIPLESAEAKERAQMAKKKLADLVDSYLNETLEKSRTKNIDNPYAQVDALRQRVKMIHNIPPKDEYEPDKQDKLNEIKKNIEKIKKSYSHK